ncbi:polysaccharide pyruvyl transferase family protein [Piscinibacter sp.]|uniref:polysaccharide pyruvyl transferase family protein n=1 Tax=Piscinibacter sp. TaxID=1903157 RepID=UPI002D02DDA7|nr:polysaccharide pyruvyl transferase family protein [Albitalea sp.]HUG26028.1 polysaccharide pyruvyl transferase family protein [Albitalea sp.]
MLERFLRRLKHRAEMALLRLQWNRHPEAPMADASSPVTRLLLIPADPWTLAGSRGDEAMMSAVVEQLRRRVPAMEVGVVTATPAAAREARRLGYVPVCAWSAWPMRTNRRIDEFKPDAMAVFGADVMDGYYNPVFTTRVLLTADRAARSGVRVTIIGFSFNDSPSAGLRPVFDGLSRAIAVHVRDQVSLDRFREFSTLPATLVADAAFMLTPDASTDTFRSVREWAGRRRAAGDAVLGFNIHPMLVAGASRQQVDRLIANSVAALRAVAGKRRSSFLLIPHDYRGASGDAACLAQIHDLLAPSLDERVMLVAGRHSAAQLKAISGLVDGLVTGRMHLAIAALGMGRPVAALTYQDKFHGLFDHFNLPRRFLLDPEALLMEGRLEGLMLEFLDSLPELERRVVHRVGFVNEAALRNLRALGAG